MKRFLLFTLVVFFFVCSSLGADESDFTAGNPMFNAFDGDGSTFAQTRSGSATASIEIPLQSTSRVTDLSFDASIPSGTTVWFEYRNSKGVFPLLETPTTFYNGVKTFGFDSRIVLADSIILRLSGDGQTPTSVYEISIVSEDSLRESRLISLDVETATSNTDVYHNELLLVDGLARTGWIAEGNSGGPIADAGTRAAVEEAGLFNRVAAPNSSVGFVELSLTEPVSSGILSLFVADIPNGTGQICGSLTVEMLDRSTSGWMLVDTMCLLSAGTGWHDIPVSSTEEITNIRISHDAFNNGTDTQITEVEFWASSLPMTRFDETLVPYLSGGIPAQETFFVLDALPSSSMILEVLSEDSGVPVETSINGLMMEPVSTGTIDGMARNTFRVPGNCVIDGINIVRALTEDLIFGMTLFDDLSKNTYSGVIDNLGYWTADRNLHLREVGVYFDTTPPTNIRQVIDGIEYTLPIAESSTGYLKLVPDSNSTGVVFDGVADSLVFRGSVTGTGDTSIIPQEVGFVGVLGVVDNYIADVTINGTLANRIELYYWLDEVMGLFLTHPNADPLALIEYKLTDIENIPYWLTKALDEGNVDLLPPDLTIIRVAEDGSTDKVFVIPVFNDTFGFGLTVNGPDGMWSTDDSQIEITGSVDSSDTYLSIGFDDVQISGGSFSHIVDLQIGLNTIPILLQDLSGHIVAGRFVQVYRYSSPLGISIMAPQDGSQVFSRSISIEGYLTGGTPESVAVNGISAVISGTSFVAGPIELTQESNLVSITAIDLFGRSINTELSVILDVTPPVIDLQNPVSGTWTGDSFVQINGYVQDTALKNVLVNGATASIIGDSYSVLLPVTEGDVVIQATATDWAGNSASSLPTTIHVDMTPPDTFDVSGDAGIWTNNPNPTISFESSDAGSGVTRYEVSIGSNAFEEQSSPYQLPFMDDGEYQGIVRAYDLVGNYVDADFEILIDTLPPDAPGNFRVVPGHSSASVRWNEDDNETIYYNLRHSLDDSLWIQVSLDEGREINDPAFTGSAFEYNISESDLIDDGETDRTISFEIYAVDRAGNEGQKISASATIGLAIASYDTTDGSIIEYETVNLIMPAGGLDDDNVTVTISEVSSWELPMEENHPETLLDEFRLSNLTVGPVYEFKVLDEIAEEMPSDITFEGHTYFKKPYIGTISYNEDELDYYTEDSEGNLQFEGSIPEERLGVYYYDEDWSRWFKVENSGIDLENNTIYFSSDHFSFFSIQPTLVNDLSPQELRDVEFTPFLSKQEHEPISVGMEGGTVSTSVTEFILPGQNGMDFELRRIYDSGTARMDASGLSVNFSVGISAFSSGTLALDLLKGAGYSVLSQVENSIKRYFMNNGDYSYSTGQGWRLNLPYIRGSNGGVLVRSPSGSFFDIHSMDKHKEDTEDNFVTRKLVYINHEREDFKIEVNQVRADVSFTSMLAATQGSSLSVNSVLGMIPGWVMTDATMTMKDGTQYNFDAFGRLVEIVPSYDLEAFDDDDDFSSITFDYSNMRLEKITDTMGRVIRFSHVDFNDFGTVPQVDRIWVENDPQERRVEYTYDNPSGLSLSAKLPLLSSAFALHSQVGENDQSSNFRQWTYNYDDRFLASGNLSLKVNIFALILTAITGGAANEVLAILGFDSIKISGGLQTEFVFLMDQASGPGIGHNSIQYKNESMVYTRTRLTDFFWGFIPTAVQVSINMKVRPVAFRHQYTDILMGSSWTRNYTYKFRYRGQGQFLNSRSTMTDGLIRVVNTYGEIDKVRPRFLTWSDVINEGLIHNSFAYYIDRLSVERSSQTFDVASGNLLHTRLSDYYTRTIRPKQVKFFYSDYQYSQTDYAYDLWGNIKVQVDKIVSGDTQYETRTERRYAYVVNHPIIGPSSEQTITMPDNPFTDPLGFDDVWIRNRLLEKAVSYTVNTPSGSEEKYLFSYYAYDAKARLISEAQHLGDEWAISQTEYDSSTGEISSIRGPVDQEVEFQWHYSTGPDDPDVKTTIYHDVVDADGVFSDIVTSEGYDPQYGFVVFTTDGNQQRTEYENDSLGRRTVITRPRMESETTAPVTSIVYDDSDLSITITDPVGAEKTLEFAHDGQLLLMSTQNRFPLDQGGIITAPEAVEHFWEYDNHGRLRSYTDPNGNSTNFEYDALGRLTKETLPQYQGVRSTRQYEYDYSTNTNTILNEEGNQTVVVYDMAGRVLSTSWYEGTTSLLADSSATYDAFGNPTSQTDPENNTINIEYDEMGNPIRKTYQSAEFFDDGEFYSEASYQRMEYDLAGHLIGTYNSFRRRGEDELILELDGLGQIIKESIGVQDSVGTQYAVTSHFYDGNGNKVIQRDPLGQETHNSYTVRNQLEMVTDSLGNVISFTYDAKDRQKSITDQRGNSGIYSGDFTIEFEYDDLDRLYLGRLPAVNPGDPKGEVRIIYDPRGNVKARIETDGGRTDYEFNDRNWIDSETRSGTRLDGSPLSYETTYTYDDIGNLISVIAPGNIPKTSEYDGLNRKVKDILSEGIEMSYQYDRRGLLTHQTDGIGAVTESRFDVLGRLFEVVDPEGGVIKYAYDERGNLSLSEDPSEPEDPSEDTLMAWFDERGLVVREEQSRGTVSTMSYDLAGRLEEILDPNGTLIVYDYTPTNLIAGIEYTSVDGLTTQSQSFSYDEAGVLKDANDNGIITRYNFESGSYVPNPFDLIKKVSETVDGITLDTAYGYDVMQRLIAIDYSDATSVSYLHNQLGQLERIPGYIDSPMVYADSGLLSDYTLTNGASATFDYDKRYRLRNISHIDSSDAPALAFDYQYDQADNILQRNQELFSYDRKGQLLTASLDGDVAAMYYQANIVDGPSVVRNDVLGQNFLVFSGDDLTFDWGAGSIGIDLGHAHDIQSFTITPSSSNHGLNEATMMVYSSVTNSVDSFEEQSFSLSIDPNDGTITITFDADLVFARYLKIHSHVNPLDEDGLPTANLNPFEVDPNGVTVSAFIDNRTEQYSYRADGNRSEVDIIPGIGEDRAYDYYPGGDLLKTDGKYAYIYDANGNLIERGDTFTWNASDPVIDQSGDYTLYEFDLLNRLISVFHADDYGGLQIAAEYRYNINGYRILRTDSSGDETRYVFDLAGNIIEEHNNSEITKFIFRKNKHLAKETADETVFYGTDHLGSTLLMTDENGASIWTGESSPFGDRTTDDSVKYTGKDKDSDTGLYYFNARWYDPVLGRFISEDPARDGLNWYVYTYNNPLKYTDPTGLAPPLIDPFSGYLRDTFNRFVNSAKVFFSREQIGETTVMVAEETASMVVDHVEKVVEHPVAGPILGVSTGIGEMAQSSKLAAKGAANIAAGNKVSGALQLAAAGYLAYDGLVRATGNTAELVDNLAGDSGDIEITSVPEIVGAMVDQPENAKKADAAVQAGLATVDLLSGTSPVSAVNDVVTIIDSVDTITNSPEDE